MRRVHDGPTAALTQKTAGGGALAAKPHDRPALARAQAVTEAAATDGFDWRSVDGVLDKLAEELAELCDALMSGDAAAVAHEVGDYLFTLVNLSRFLGVDAEAALHGTTDRFVRRYHWMVADLAAEGLAVSDLDEEELEVRWQAAKKVVG